ncbi:hypothetical protein Tco_0525263 [Tanacetum coccineum]
MKLKMTAVVTLITTADANEQLYKSKLQAPNLVSIAFDTLNESVITLLKPLLSLRELGSLLSKQRKEENLPCFDLGRLIKFVHTRIASVAIRDVTACVTSESNTNVNIHPLCAFSLPTWHTPCGFGPMSLFNDVMTLHTCSSSPELSFVPLNFKKPFEEYEGYTKPSSKVYYITGVGIKSLLEVTAAKISLLEDMDSESTHMVAASKVPMLKPVVEGVEKVIALTTAEEKAQKRLEVKARSTLMMGIPNEHQLKLNSIKDVKLLLEAIEKSQLEILGETLSQEDVNQNLLRSLSPEWNTHAIVWRNKPELETIMDDLYNNLKVYEPEVKRTSSSSTNTQNMNFVSSNNSSSTNEAINTTHRVSTASTQANAANPINVDNLSDDVICAFFASQPSSPQLANKDL